MSDTNGNGNGVTWKWTVGILFAAFVSIGGWAWSSTVARVIELEVRDRQTGERVAVVETQIKILTVQLDRIEQKVDVLLRSGLR